MAPTLKAQPSGAIRRRAIPRRLIAVGALIALPSAWASVDTGSPSPPLSQRIRWVAPAPTAPTRIQLLRELGTKAIDSGDPKAAVGPLLELTTLTPNDPMAHVALGTALAALGNHARAVSCFRRGG
jgi:hypothetical protein